MSYWKIATAQCEPLHTSIAEHVAHYLQLIRAVARCQYELLVFPFLSLLGCVDENDAFPAPPDEALLEPFAHAVATYRMTIIAGLPMGHNNRFVKGIALFSPWMTSPLTFHQSHGVCIARQRNVIGAVDSQPEGIDIDPAYSLFTNYQSVSKSELLSSTSHLQSFSHKFVIAVLMANARGSSALWDERDRLIVHAGNGSLLLTDQHTLRGWQGDIISLRQSLWVRSMVCCAQQIQKPVACRKALLRLLLSTRSTKKQPTP